MKKLLLTVALLIATTVTAQTPTNYDGGSDLQKAILKTKSKQPASKKTTTVTVTELKPPARTKEETTYFLLHKEEAPSYLRKLVESDYWKQQQKIAEVKEMEGYAERVEKRKQDSIKDEEIRKHNIIAMEKMKKDTQAASRRQDSIANAEREKYLEEQRRQQKANKKRPRFFR